MAALEVFKMHALWAGMERDLSGITLESTKGFLIHTEQQPLRPLLYQLYHTDRSCSSSEHRPLKISTRMLLPLSPWNWVAGDVSAG